MVVVFPEDLDTARFSGSGSGFLMLREKPWEIEIETIENPRGFIF